MPRPVDSVQVEAIDTNSGVFDRFTSLEITNDLTGPAEASFECGDDGTWRSMEDLIAPGSRYRVVVNGRLRLTGRVEADDVPTDAAGGATVRFVVRTKLSDAAYASALPTISVLNTSLKSLVLQAYAPLGFGIDDFVFKTDVSRDLMTGRGSRGGATKPVDLEPLQLEEAKVRPPETIFEFVERHLLRFHLSHWDSPDGKIVVGAPDNEQHPLYSFRLKKGAAGRANNLLTAHRIRDFSESPSTVSVVGVGGKWNFAKASVVKSYTVPDVTAAKFKRPIYLVENSIKTSAQTLGRAQREAATRSKKIDAWEIATDGLSYWDGSSLIPFGVDTLADVDIDTAGGATGSYLVHRVTLRRDAQNGDSATMSLLRRGLWLL